MWVEVRKVEHQLDLKDELTTLLKFSDRPFKSCDEFTLRRLEVKSEAFSARTEGKFGMRRAMQVVYPLGDR
jgi:hypothetical protein